MTVSGMWSVLVVGGADACPQTQKLDTVRGEIARNEKRIQQLMNSVISAGR